MVADNTQSVNVYREFNIEILSRLDIEAELTRLGMRWAGDADSDGWRPCHAINRPDNNPSASVNVRSGWYVDHATGEKRGPWDSLAALGNHADWKGARDHYADRLGVERPRQKKDPDTWADDNLPRDPGPRDCCRSCGGRFNPGSDSDENSCTCNDCKDVEPHTDQRYCPRGVGCFLRHRKSGRMNHCRLACDCWSCGWCRKSRMLPRWKVHIREMFLTYNARVHDRLGMSASFLRYRVPVANWPKYRKALSRGHGDWLKVKPADDCDHLIIWTTIPIGKRDELEFERYELADAIKQVHIDLSACRASSRPVSGSKPQHTTDPAWSDLLHYGEQTVQSGDIKYATKLGWGAFRKVDQPNDHEMLGTGGRFDAAATRTVAQRHKLSVSHVQTPQAVRGTVEWMSLAGTDTWSRQRCIDLVKEIRSQADANAGLTTPMSVRTLGTETGVSTARTSGGRGAWREAVDALNEARERAG